MPNIVMTRIDNRLVHGQIMASWCLSVGANVVLVANDAAAENTLRQSLMDMSAPSFVKVRYWPIEKTIEDIHKVSEKQKIFLVVENPQDVLKLVEGGVPIKKINVGNMPMAEGKRQVAISVAVDKKDVEAFIKLRELGIEMEIKRVTSEEPRDIEKIFE